ncbi:DUF2218 domain-containing protein [Maritimibacter sp. UBA3975]|uniref:DUF2218 domain-containing protein n=1 Tax=Maritimibacter sp. UBA3975 TaxID=1946833 RepID=UPI000C0B4E9C|nr:DUF2218 domain-containing protein [Maritimibacter sp. UBA3975]MAM61763.1 2,4-dihydroxyhept-2-ene-1,7-dioic acid aldolase [Maritimibacter sp.]
MKTADAYWKTENGSKYLQQLCKHFAHKLDTTCTPEEGRIDFPFGPVKLRADDGGLWIEVTGEDDETVARAKDVVDRHLARFAFREEFEHMPWAA